MKSASDQNNNLLPVKKTEPIHFVDENGERVLVPCLVLEETSLTDNFLIKAVGEPSSLVITNVEPSADDEEKVVLTFRNLSNIEILERIGTGVLPAYMLDALFGGTDDLIRNEMEKALGGKEKLAEADTTSFYMLKIGLLISHHNDIPQVNDLTEYKVTAPLEATHLAEIINVSTGGPAFALVTSGSFAAYKRRKADKRPLVSDLTTLTFPMYGSGDFTNATEVLTQKLTGHYLISPSQATEYKVRGDILSLVVGLAHGSKDALIKTFRLLNSTNKAVEVVNKRSAGDYSITPSPAQIENVIFNEIADQAYQLLTSDTLSQVLPQSILQNTIQEDEDALSSEDAALFREMFKSSGLNDVFKEALSAQTSSKEAPEPDSSLEDVLDYFSSRITMESFPETMEPLKDSLYFPALFDYNWASEEPENKKNRISSGVALVSKIFTLAVRYARLTNLAQTTEVPMSPVAMLIQVLSGGHEPSGWAVEETIRRLPRSADGLDLFSEVIISGLIHPKIDSGPLPVKFLIRSLLPHVLHRTGHVIYQEGWKHEEIMNVLPPYSLLTPFIDGLFENEPFDEDEERNCPALEAALQALVAIDFQEQGLDLVNELGVLLVELANIKAAEELPETAEKDPAYLSFLENYLVTQLLANGRV